MRNERGAVTVITAVFISAIIAGVAIVADIGLIYQEKRQLQTAVDSAALAGVMEMAEGGAPAAAENVAAEYLLSNSNLRPDSVDFTYPGDNAFSVRAKTNRSVFFGRIFGIDDAGVVASATAKQGVANAVGDLSPIIVPSNSIPGHIGPGNRISFEFGEDRPLDPFSIRYDRSGDLVTYTISYTNTRNKAVNLELWSPLPGGSVYGDGSATGGGIFDGTQVKWIFNNLAAGDNRTVSYIVSTAETNPSTAAYAKADNGQTEQASDNNAQKGFFWLTNFDADSGGVPDYRDWIIDGYPELVYIGDVVNGTGMKASLKDALDVRFSSKPEMVLPVYDYTENGGSQGTYHVIGFAEFIMTESDLTGNPKTVTGYFTDGTVMPGAGGEGATDFGIRAIWLSE